MSAVDLRVEAARNAAELARLKEKLRGVPPLWLHPSGAFRSDALVEAALLSSGLGTGAFVVIDATNDGNPYGHSPATAAAAAAAASAAAAAATIAYHLWYVQIVSEDLRFEEVVKHEIARVDGHDLGGDTFPFVVYKGDHYSSIEQVVAQNPRHFVVPFPDSVAKRARDVTTADIHALEARNIELAAARSRILSIVDIVVVSGNRERTVRYRDDEVISRALLDRPRAKIHEFLTLINAVNNPTEALIFYGDMQILTGTTSIAEMMRHLEFETRRPPRLLVVEAWRSDHDPDGTAPDSDTNADAPPPLAPLNTPSPPSSSSSQESPRSDRFKRRRAAEAAAAARGMHVPPAHTRLNFDTDSSDEYDDDEYDRTPDVDTA
jgi:hypothetical protein